ALEIDPTATSETSELAAVSPTMATSGSVTESDQDEGGSRVLTYSGIAVAGLGAAALGVGGYFGIQSLSKRDVDRGPDGTSQVDVPGIEKEANDAAGMANIMFAVGGGVVGVGALLIALDLIVLDGSDGPATSVSVGADSAAATLTWTW
ncbi:hypothetical protein ACFL6C_11320, partial [Myxococcota bacterium]